MKALNRESIYIDLKGKSKEELTGIYNLLISLKQNMYSSLERDLVHMREWSCYEFYAGFWCLSNNTNKQEVTIEQLKEILQPMGTFKKGDTIIITDFGTAVPDGVFSLNRPYKLRKDITEGLKVEKDNDGFENGYSLETTKTMKFELYENALEQQLQKAKAEVERLEKLINAKNELKRIQKLIESLENEI